MPLVAIMKDGRVISTDGTRPSDAFVQELRARLNADPESFVRGRGGRGRAGGSAADAAGGRARRRGSRQHAACAARAAAGPIIVDGVPVGVVIAMPRSALRQLGPTLAMVGAVLVVLGTTVAALLIFGPVRPRLRSLEDAARTGWRRRSDRSRARRRRRRSGGARARVQSDDARSAAARRAAAGRRSHAAAAARRRLARADDAADRHARLSRNALAPRADRSTPTRASAISPSFATKRSASSTSSAICWICRASKAAASRSTRRMCRSRICSGACSRATGGRPNRRASRSRRTSRPARKSSPAIRCGSSRRCRTLRRTRCATRRKAGAWR